MLRNRWSTSGRVLFGAVLGFCALQGSLLGMALYASQAQAADDSVSDSVKKAVAEKLSHNFKNFTYDDIKPSEIPGIYEVYSGPRIIYFAPDQNLMIFGELYRTDGKSVTAEKVAALQDQRAQKIDHDAGVAIGDGSATEVLAFVDPDCGYCKRAHEWLRDQQLQGKIKEVVFFMPLKDRPDALAKAENLVCAPPALRGAALDDLWSRKPVDQMALLKCDDAGKKLAAEAEEARRFGVQGTPTFVVKGQVVAGFDRARLQTLLSTQSTTE